MPIAKHKITPCLWFDTEAEEAGLYKTQVKARDLYGRMMRTIAQTGNGWMTFKDKSNRACNQTARPGRTVHLSNLCTEILEVTSGDEIGALADQVIDFGLIRPQVGDILLQ